MLKSFPVANWRSIALTILGTIAIAPPSVANPVPTPIAPSPAIGTRGILNGGFEQPAQTNTQAGAAIPMGYTNNPPVFWLTTDNSTTYNKKIEIWTGAPGAGGQSTQPAGTGTNNQYAELNGGANASLYQDICVLPGENIGWSLDHAARQFNSTYPNPTNIMEVSITNPDDWTATSLVPPTNSSISYQSGNRSVIFNNGWQAQSGSWTSTNTDIKKLRFAFRAIQGSQSGVSNGTPTYSDTYGNFIDNVKLKLAPIVDFAPTDATRNVNIATTTEGNTLNNYYLTLRVNGVLEQSGSVDVSLSGLNDQRTFTVGTPLKGTAAATGLTATKTNSKITLNLPAGSYDPNRVADYIHIPIDFSNTTSQPNDNLSFSLSNPTGGGGSGLQLLIKASSCLGSPTTQVNTQLIDDDLKSITGTVWRDHNNSAKGTLNNIFTNGEIGTNAGGLNAILLNSSNSIIAAKPVGTDGTYQFTGLSTNQNNLKIVINPSTTATTPALPTGWLNTSPLSQTFNLADADLIGKDFGITQRGRAILVKRITGIKQAGTSTINRNLNPNDNKPLNLFVNNTNSTDPSYQNALDPLWPGYTSTNGGTNTYTIGAVDAGKVQPGDEIEYTIYYLNNRGADLNSLNICDPIRGRHSYVANSIELKHGNGSIISLTDAIDPTIDRAHAYLAGNAPTNCNASATTATGIDRGGISVRVIGTGSSNQSDLGAIPSASTAGAPSSYGWLRFRTKVDP